MNAKTTRILKEARPLFWPWCAVVCAGALPLLHPPYPLGEISVWGFFSVYRCWPLFPSETNSRTGLFPSCFLNPSAGWKSGARS